MIGDRRPLPQGRLGTTRRLAFALSLTAAAAAVGAGTASAQVISATATSTPKFATFPKTDSAEFRLRLVTGANPVSPASVGFLIPKFGHDRVGWTLRLGDLRLEGPGRVGDAAPIHVDPFGDPCFRGYASRFTGVPVSLPANSTSTLVVPATLVSDPPWEDTSYRLGFAVAGRRVYAPGPITRGPYGLRLDIHLRMPDGERPQPLGDLFLGESVTVVGSTSPRLRNAPIILRFASSRVVRRRVRTDSLGRFSYRWMPGRADSFWVNALYRPRAGGARVRDESCTARLQVVESRPATP